MRTAVIIPAYNEALTLRDVILDFNRQNPESAIVVINNNSSDDTAAIARKTLSELSGSSHLVLSEKRQGKANALRSAFQQVNADIYVIVDADRTYNATDLPKLLDPVLRNEADMVVGDRLSSGDYHKENKRPFHSFGNNLVRTLINTLFKTRLKDIMSGFRVLNRRFVKNYPMLCEGFEVETDMTLHAVDKKFRIVEIPIMYKDRPAGSHSKLNTFKDGGRVLRTIFSILKDYRPLLFFSILSFITFVLGLLIGTPVVYEFIEYKYIYKIPSAILASGFVIISILLYAIGLILDTVVKLHNADYAVKLLND